MRGDRYALVAAISACFTAACLLGLLVVQIIEAMR